MCLPEASGLLSRDPMKFLHKDKVIVYDTDYQGVVHYASYYRFVTNAANAFVLSIVLKGLRPRAFGSL